jgi:hypothetical protein
MTEPSAHRTLVKSPPELWAEVSEPEALARHLGEFGDIRITRLEPETTVAWEGERASGTVHLEPSSWGTKVTLTASATPSAPPEPAPRAEPEAPRPVPAPRGSRWGRFLRRRAEAAAPAASAPPAPEPAASPEPELAASPAPEPAAPEQSAPRPAAQDSEAIVAKLGAVLDDLGAAHHRPFSR